jgi:alkylhydroperoxidase family enzyme
MSMPLIISIAAAALLVASLAAFRARRQPRLAAGAPLDPADGSGARLPGVTDRQAGWLARIAFRTSRRMTGAVATPIRVLAQHRRVLLGFGLLETAQGSARQVPRPLKDLAVLRAASIIGCEWCMDIGAVMSRRSGVSQAKLERLTRPGPDVFSPVELLVLALAEQMTQTPCRVSAELFDALRLHFDAPALVELLAEIAVENLRGRFNCAIGVAPQGFDAAACALPAGAARP